MENIWDNWRLELWSILGLKWPRNWASGVNIQYTTKSSSNWHYTKTDAKPVENVWENYQSPEFLLIFWPKVDQKLWPLRSMFSTHLRVLAMSMWSNTDVKPVKIFWENGQRLEFLPIVGPKMAPNWASGAHIPHTSKITCNELVKQYWWKTS